MSCIHRLARLKVTVAKDLFTSTPPTVVPKNPICLKLSKVLVMALLSIISSLAILSSTATKSPSGFVLVSSSSTSPGTIETVAGNGGGGSTYTGSAATSVGVGNTKGVAVDGAGDIIFSSIGYSEIYFVAESSCSSNCPYGLSSTTGGDIYTIAGDGSTCSPGGSPICGDGGAATSAQLNHPVSVALDSGGDVIIADYGSAELRLVAKSSCSSGCPFGLASTTAGDIYDLFNGYKNWSCGGNPANLDPTGLALDGSGNLFFGDAWTDSVFRLPSSGGTTIYDVAGQASGCQNQGYSGDGGLATNATLNLGFSAIGLEVDSSSNLLITDISNNRVRMVANATCSSSCAYGLSSTTANDIYTIAGDGTGCTSSSSTTCGDGGSPTSAEINNPDGIATDATGQVFVSDKGDNRIWKFPPNGQLIQTVADANGTTGFYGDGGQAEAASLDSDANVSIENGNLFVADFLNSRVREVYGAGVAGPLTTGVGPTGTDKYGANSGVCAGDPVNCATGNYYSTSTDVNIPFRDLPLEVTRTYNSLAATGCSASSPGQFGCGFSSILGDSISFAAGGTSAKQTATIVTDSGATVVFTCSSNGTTCSGTWDPPAWHPSDSLTYDSGTTSYRFQDMGNLTYIFTDITSGQTFGANGSSGVLSGIKDLNGYVESFDWCTSSTCTANSTTFYQGQLENIVDPNSRNLWLTYSSSTSPIASITEPSGVSISYSYDTTNWNLTGVTINHGSNFSSDPNRSWTYGYSTPSNHLMTSVTDPNSLETDVAYNSSGQATSTTQVCASGDTSCSGLTHPNRTTSFSYYSYEAGTSPNQYPVSTTIITDPVGNIVEENFIQYTLVSETDGLGSSSPRTTYYGYSNALRSTSVTNPDGQLTSYTYDSNGNMTQKTDPLNQVTNYTYDSHNRVKSYEPPQTTAETDPVETFYLYDSNENLQCSVTITNQSSPSAPSNCTGLTNPSVLKPATIYTYGNGTINANGTVGSSGTNGGWPGDVVETEKVNYSGDPENVTTYTYDGYGDVLSKTVDVSTGNETTSYQYNTNTGTLSCTVSANGYSSIASPVCNSTSYITKYTYNDLNQTEATLSPTGGLVLNAYDTGGRMTSVQSDSDATSTTPDDTGCKDSDSGDTSGGSEGTTSYSYDSFGEVLSVTSPCFPVNGTAQSSGQVTSKTYDQNGNLLTVTDANSAETSYTYDSLNRVATETQPDGLTTTYKYDPAGNTLAATDTTSTSSSWALTSNMYAYDGDNQVSSETMSVPGSASNLTQVSCGYSTSCESVGANTSNGPSIVAGSTSSWNSTLASNIPSGVNSLNSISCASQTTCYAVGSASGSPAPSAIKTTNSGQTWASAAPSGSGAPTTFNQIACPSTTTCFASYGSSLYTTTNSGTNWTQVTGTPTWSINSITCPSTTDCFFVGTSSGTGEIEEDNNGTLSSHTYTGTATALNSISCPTTSLCVAVGTASSTDAAVVTDDSTNGWVAHSTTDATDYVGVGASSYPSASDWYAVGSNGTTPAMEQISLSGTTWTLTSENSSVPYGTASLSSVSCGSSSGCIASGSTTAGAGELLVTSNSGSTWTTQFKNTTFTYDKDGHRLTMKDGIDTNGEVQYTYDSLGRLTSQDDEHGTTTSYGYDLVNNMTSITYPGSHSVDRTFDGANNLLSVATWLGAPNSGTCPSITSDTTDFAYDLNNNLTSTTLPVCDSSNTPAGKDTVSNSYYNDNTLNTTSATFNGTAYSLAYTRNGFGQVTKRNLDSGFVITNYTYDPAGRIATAGSESFGYDNAGNISCNGQDSSSPYYTYNSANEQTYSYASCYSTATQENTFSYDVYGDRTEETYPSGGTQVPLYYAYANSLGEMTSYTAFFTTTNYTYNGDGQLMDESQGSTTLASMVYDETSSIPKILSDGTWDFIYGPKGEAFEAIKISTSTPEYFFLDTEGSVIGDISTSGAVSNGSLYDTWGKAPSSGAPPISFDNAYYDSATGFFYLLNRFYDYEKGQFVTVEPRIMATSQPFGYGGVVPPSSGGLSVVEPSGVTQTGVYQYSNDDPVNQKDMTGLCGNSIGTCLSQLSPLPPANGEQIVETGVYAEATATLASVAMLETVGTLSLVALPMMLGLAAAGGFLIGLGVGQIYNSCA